MFAARLPFLVMSLLVLVPNPARAENPLDKFVTDERVNAALQLALKNLHNARCENNQPCAAATEEELRQPPILPSDARAAMRVGINSAMMGWCGLDWTRRSFLPMMTNYREIMKMSERQTALLGLLHGMQQGLIQAGLSSKPCSVDTRRKLDMRIPGRQLR